MLADDGVLTADRSGRPRAAGHRGPPDDPGAARGAPRPPGRRPSARSSRRRPSRARSSRASASRRWWATSCGESTGSLLRGSCARTSSGPWDRMRRRTASATSSSATPRTTGCPRSCAPACTSASPTGWSTAGRPARRSSTSSSATTSSAQCGCAASSARPTSRPPRSPRGRRRAFCAPDVARPPAGRRRRAARMLERAAALAPGAERPTVLVDLAGALKTEANCCARPRSRARRARSRATRATAAPRPARGSRS